jgi:hypothetical protein
LGRDTDRYARKPVRQPGRLGHGVLAEITITVVSGVLTAALSDALKALVARACDRGKVKDVSEEPTSVGGHSVRLMVPKTRLGMWTRNTITRLPLMQAMAGMERIMQLTETIALPQYA